MPRVGPVPVHFAAAVHVAGHPSPAAPRTWTRCPPRACHNHYTTQCHSPPFIIVRDALGILTDLLKPFSRYPLSSLSTKYVCPCHTLTRLLCPYYTHTPSINPPSLTNQSCFRLTPLQPPHHTRVTRPLTSHPRHPHHHHASLARYLSPLFREHRSSICPCAPGRPSASDV